VPGDIHAEKCTRDETAARSLLALALPSMLDHVRLAETRRFRGRSDQTIAGETEKIILGIKMMMESSLSFKARLAGLFYLLTFVVAGISASLVRGVIVPDNATSTATNILAHETRVWLFLTCNLIVIACYIAVTALFYELFAPVSLGLSRVAALFSLVGCATQASAFSFFVAPLILLRPEPQQLALTLLFLNLHSRAYDVGLVFFGFYCVLIGCLAFKSRFLPRVLGTLMVLSGVAWLTFLYPPLASGLRPYNMSVGAIGEGLLTLWLLVKGVRQKS
jgi:hypothetical protein